MNISIRIRTTLGVTVALACVLVAASFWFNAQLRGTLLSAVRNSDSAEIDRQIDVLNVFGENLENESPGALPTIDLRDLFIFVVIPGDGTRISVRSMSGEVLGSSDQSLGWLTRNEYGLAAAGSMTGQPEVFDRFDAASTLIDTTGPELMEVMFEPRPQSEETQEHSLVSRDSTVFLGTQVEIVATSDISGIVAVTEQISWALFGAVFLATLFAASVIFFSTGRALQPVEEMIAQVEGIDSIDADYLIMKPRTNDEIERLASKMNQMLTRIHSLVLSKRQSVSDISHELRTPIALIQAEIEAGLSESDNDWAQTGQSVLAEASRLSGFVDNFVMLTNLDEHNATEPTELDFDDLLSEELQRYRNSFASVVIEPVKIDGHAPQISRLIQNLIGNAVRHADSEVAVELLNDGSSAVLVVEDDGEGIPHEERDYVFERFARLDAGRKRDGGGAGLGLAIVREVATRHGGSATVGASTCGGARFEVRIPLGAQNVEMNRNDRARKT